MRYLQRIFSYSTHMKFLFVAGLIIPKSKHPQSSYRGQDWRLRTFKKLVAMDMDSIVLQPTEEGISRASQLLQDGRLVAFPTETVYGLGANALDENAVMSIFTAKGRPTSDPLIVHIADIKDAERLTVLSDPVRDLFFLLGQRFWPGPLTLIVRAAPCIPNLVTANTGMVGIRCPAHPIARALLTACSLPIAAPSANRFGHVSPTRYTHVIEDLGEKGIHVINGDNSENIEDTCRHGIESTVAKIDAEKKTVFILRQGAITRQDIRGVLDSSGRSDWSVEIVVRSVLMESSSHTNSVSAALEPSNEGELAPGQAITHYAPSIPCFIAISAEAINMEADRARISTTDMLVSDEKLSRAVLIDFGGMLQALRYRVLAYTDISPDRNINDGARQLFLSLRWAESVPNAQYVFLADVTPSEDREYAEYLDSLGPGLADRMQRAASGLRVNLKYHLVDEKIII